MHSGICSNCSKLSPLSDKSKSLVLVNYFKTIPFQKDSCMHHLGVSSTCFTLVMVQLVTAGLTLLLSTIIREVREEYHFKQWTHSTGSCCVDVTMYMHVWWERKLGRKVTDIP